MDTIILMAFLNGVLLAFGLIIPLGPQNVFLLSQGVTQPKILNAFPAWIVASIADSLLIVLAVSGVSAVIVALPEVKAVLVIGGVGFLIYVGWSMWRAQPDVEGPSFKRMTVKEQILFTASVSLLNPHAILDTVAVIGTSSLNYNAGAKIAFTAACIATSWLWFLSLILVGRFFKKVDKSGRITGSLNRFSAIVMWMSALFLIYISYFKL